MATPHVLLELDCITLHYSHYISFLLSSPQATYIANWAPEAIAQYWHTPQKLSAHLLPFKLAHIACIIS